MRNSLQHSCRIYAIGDCHLPVSYYTSKYQVPEDYFEQLRSHLEEEPPDLLLIAGDLSWAKTLNEAKEDLNAIKELPGRHKVFIEGNHDSWFNSLGTTLQAAQEKAYQLFSYFDLYYIGGRATSLEMECGYQVGLCGSCGYESEIIPPRSEEWILKKAHEIDSLNRSLSQLQRLPNVESNLVHICLLHYPPSTKIFSDNRKGDNHFFRKIFDVKKVQKIIFGHVHVDPFIHLKTTIAGIGLYCVSLNLTDYQPVSLMG